MFSRRIRKLRVIFGFWDALMAYFAFEGAYYLRSVLPFFQREFFLFPTQKLLLMAASAAIFVFAGYLLRTYEELPLAGAGAMLASTTKQVALGSVGIVLVEYLARADLSRAFLALFVALTWVTLCATRTAAPQMARWAGREFGRGHHVVIVGSGRQAEAVRAAIEEEPDTEVRLTKVDELRAADELPSLLRRHVVDEVIFAVDSATLAALEDVFLLCDEEGVRTRFALAFFPHVHSDVYLDRLGSAPMLTFSATPHDEVRLLTKRLIDVVASAVGLVVLAPLLILVALLIRFTSPGPAIFRQQRCGLNGRRFVVYKFRSMVANAEDLRPQLEARNERQVVFKMADDPRLTPVGRWLRKFSLDELPQLWNVLRGDMSLVGPRPALPSEVEQYQRWQRRRLRMRPGLTCLWAIRGRDKVEFSRWMELDMEYIDNWSLSLDAHILLRTVPEVLLGKGAS